MTDAERIATFASQLEREGYPKLTATVGLTICEFLQFYVEMSGEAILAEMADFMGGQAKRYADETLVANEVEEFFVRAMRTRFSKETLRPVLKNAVRAFQTAKIVLWSQTTYDLVQQAMPMAYEEKPTPDEIEIEPQIWLVQPYIEYKASDDFANRYGVPQPCELEALLVLPSDTQTDHGPGRMISIIGLFVRPSKDCPIVMRHLAHILPGEPLGATAPIDLFVFSGLDFLTQKFVSLEPPPRPEKRRLEKAHRNKRLPDVRSVLLRKPETRKSQEAGGESHYSVQFFVTRHLRKQWYPSKNGHRPKWIEPYIKGPDNAPFKPPTRSIYQANR
jgi:hypothetical protein